MQLRRLRFWLVPFAQARNDESCLHKGAGCELPPRFGDPFAQMQREWDRRARRRSLRNQSREDGFAHLSQSVASSSGYTQSVRNGGEIPGRW